MSTHQNGTRRPPPSDRPKGGRSDPLPSDLQAAIGRRLKAEYESVLSEPIPERFTELLDALERTGDGDGGGTELPADDERRRAS